MTASQQQRWKYELEIIQELKRIPSSREMTKLLKEKFGLNVNHNTVNTDLKKDLESLSQDGLLNKKESILSKLEQEFDIAHTIATTEPDNKLRLDAMKTASKLSKTISDVCAIFNKAQADIDRENRPVYEVILGEPQLVNEEDLKRKEKEKDESTDKYTDENLDEDSNIDSSD